MVRIMSVFVLLISLSVVNCECHCESDDLCETFPTRPCSTGGGPDRCQQGWFGAYCQKENVALNRPSNQSSIYRYFGLDAKSSLAVDGIASHSVTSWTCSVNDRQDANPSWTVHLNKTVTDKIRHIKLYLSSNGPETNNGMKIKVDDELCYDWLTSDRPNSTEDVTCRQPLTGNTVTITVPATNVYSLCEVQIFICSDGWFGDDCDKQCNCQHETEVCDKISGLCSSRCAAGFNGTDCQTYGKCHCRRPSDCEIFPSRPCSEEGRPDNCQPGWFGPYCQKPCDDGMYGLGCSSSCGHCTNSSICDKMTGHCLNGCQGNFTLPVCQECLGGYFGPNCNETCNGKCPRGCVSGNNQDVLCRTECSDGYFGPNCDESCGMSEKGDPCKKTTGRCPRGCAAGYNQEDVLCRPFYPEPTVQFDVVATAAGGAAAILILIVVIVVVIIFTKRRQREHGESNINNGNTRCRVEGAMQPLELNAVMTDGNLRLLDEDAVFCVENDLHVSNEDMSTYYNWVPSGMTLDKLQNCVMNMKTRSQLERELKAIPCGLRHAHDVGKKLENKVKNCFASMYPYDHSRVILDGDGYINASYITGSHGTPGYIATQGPTCLTFGDFWRMIWQERVMTVVMLTQLVEHNKKESFASFGDVTNVYEARRLGGYAPKPKKKKCDKYWPNPTETKQYGGFTVTNKEVTVRADYTMSKLVIHNTDHEDRTVRHFQYTTWPDGGIPSAPALVSFWKKVKQEDKTGPLVVHCSAGVGRTGTFIALDYLVDEYESEYKVNVFRCVTRMREARMNMVQTLSQYQFVHDAVLEAVYSRDTKYTSTDLTTLLGTEDINSEKLENNLKQQFKVLQSLRLPLPDLSQPFLYENDEQDNIYENKAQLGACALAEKGYDCLTSQVLPSAVHASMLVVTETPHPKNVTKFWRLVADHDCFTTVCLDVSKEARDIYPDAKREIHYGSVTVKHIGNTDTDVFRETRLMLTNTNQQGSRRPVNVFTLKSLDTMSCDTFSLLTLVNRVDAEICSTGHKVLIHCPDGSHACGIFCAALNAIGQLRLDSEVDIFLTVRELHCVQPRFIQTYVPESGFLSQADEACSGKFAWKRVRHGPVSNAIFALRTS